ncbi:hypothetical protein, unlikely [Trypanosoma brucei gambiense DAL972]|uniref:Uncharacterized protein n=1 Tax=Trypanosoma brucei gambiense (strain MHOM/CI/86/DAL972) TaxID=679716 RepID=C9ZPN0_TRYB9|nr:hypothetical protein, unlikely [Trypanosoma brucei gambiense DAL972]CBH11358.1 hypothetical protein, unlikely [Trypanosoma brucei gambiense DAL972]|eukprot:XP_011773645.1 hypothetical protein, unlikely [Trypanosoma brucei gambiense DAL972]
MQTGTGAGTRPHNRLVSLSSLVLFQFVSFYFSPRKATNTSASKDTKWLHFIFQTYLPTTMKSGSLPNIYFTQDASISIAGARAHARIHIYLMYDHAKGRR